MRTLTITRGAISFFSVLLLAGCAKDGRKSGLASGTPVPVMTGSWVGNVNLNNAVTKLDLTVDQSTLNIRGTYTQTPACDASQPDCAAFLSAYVGTKGTVTGVTSGPAMELQLQPSDATCFKA